MKHLQIGLLMAPPLSKLRVVVQIVCCYQYKHMMALYMLIILLCVKYKLVSMKLMLRILEPKLQRLLLMSGGLDLNKNIFLLIEMESLLGGKKGLLGLKVIIIVGLEPLMSKGEKSLKFILKLV